MNATGLEDKQNNPHFNQHKLEISNNKIKTKCGNKYLDWLTLKIRDEQIERRFRCNTQPLENFILGILLLFVDILYFEEFVLNSSLYHLVVGSISLIISLLIICCFPRKPILIHLLKFQYLIVFGLFLYSEFYLQKRSIEDDGVEQQNSHIDEGKHNKRIHKFYNYQYLIILSCSIFYNNWIVSACIIYISSIWVYLHYRINFFSLSQIICFTFPLLFYHTLRREKILYAITSTETINILEQIIPMGFIIIRKNDQQAENLSLLQQLLSFLGLRQKSNLKGCKQQDEQREDAQNPFNVCMKGIRRIVGYPCILHKRYKERNKQYTYKENNYNQQLSSQRQMINKNNLQQGDLLTNIRKMPFSSSGSTYTSSLQTLLGNSDFSISYCNQFFLNHFATANTSPNSPQYKPLISPFQTTNLNNKQNKNQINFNNLNHYKFSQSSLIHIIMKSLKRMNIAENPFSSQSPKTHNIQTNNQMNPILTQLNIVGNKDDKQYTSAYKIPTQSQQDTPIINKQQYQQQIILTNNATSQNQNSPFKDDQQQHYAFSNINLWQKTQHNTDSKVNQNQNLNSNNTVVFSSKNILSPEDVDANRPLYSFKNVIGFTQQYGANKANNNTINNSNKSKFISVNPCSPSNINSGEDEFSNPQTNRNILFQPAQHQQYIDIIQQTDNKEKNPSIMALDDADKIEDKNRNPIQTVYDYIKQRLQNPLKFQKRRKFLQQEFNTLEMQFMENNNNNNKDVKVEEEGTNINEEVINCYQIDDKSDMKKRISVQFTDGEWQGEQVLFVLTNRNFDSSEQILSEKLKEVETFKSSLLKTVSHDLKTPLNGMTIILEDIIQYFKQKQKQLYTKFQKQNNQNMQNTQSLAYIQYSSNDNNGISAFNFGSSQNIPQINGLTNLNQAQKSGNSDNVNNYNNPKSLKISTNLGNVNYKEKKIQINKHIENLNQIVYSTKILTSVIDDILDYSAIKIQNFRLNTDQFDFRSFLYEIKDLFQKTFEQKKLSFQLEFPFSDQSSIIIYNDQKRIKQVLINMISNSVKYTQKGYCKIIVQKNENNPNIMTISVKDSGNGMDEKTKHKLFQLYENTDSDIHGVGLGLVICRNMIGFLGPSEEIEVESELGKGSTFRFQIYVQNNTQSQRSGIRKDYQNTEIQSVREIQLQKNSIHVSGVNIFANQRRLSNPKIKESSNHSLRVTHSVQPLYGNKSLFLQSPTLKKHKKAHLHNSVQSFDQLPKKALDPNNIQLIQQIQGQVDKVEKDLLSVRTKCLKTLQDSPLEIVINNSNKNHDVSIILAEDKGNNNLNNFYKTLNKDIFNGSQNLIQGPSQRSIRIKNVDVYKPMGFNQNGHTIQKDIYQNSYHNQSQFPNLNEINHKKQFLQVQQHTNDLSSYLESINYEETPSSKQDKPSNNHTNFNEAMNRDNLVILPESKSKKEIMLNDIKSQQYSQSFDGNSINKSNNLTNNNTKNNNANLGDSHAEYQSIDQEQYIIPEFDHNTNNLQEHFMQVPNKRILIVDDNIFNQNILESLLKNIYGIELIDRAENGQIAIDKINELFQQRGISYDLILMDWQMPILDGLSATLQIRELPFLQDNPPYIMFVTASSAQEKDKVLSVGNLEFLIKCYENI